MPTAGIVKFNMIMELPKSHGRILGFKISGKIHEKDLERFAPKVDAAVATYGRVCMLARFQDFHGWDMSALWNDIKFTAAHSADFDRIAMVGDRPWEQWMAAACRPFLRGQVRYFDADHENDAWDWLES